MYLSLASSVFCIQISAFFYVTYNLIDQKILDSKQMVSNYIDINWVQSVQGTLIVLIVQGYNAIHTFLVVSPIEHGICFCSETHRIVLLVLSWQYKN